MNVPAPAEKVIAQVDDQVRMKLISQLISGISRVLQKLNKHLMVLLFQHPLNYNHLVFFLLFLTWI